MTDSSTNREGALQRAGDFATRVIAGETILVPIRKGVADLESVFTLDEVGSAIWRSLESPKSIDEVVGNVVREFEVSEDEARRDVSELLSTMIDSGLLQLAKEGP